jgi:translation elongation factor EF-Tu-like GTPase
VFSIKGRGTVATGRIERGKVKIGDNIEIVGFTDTKNTVITGIEQFQKTLDEGIAGDNVSIEVELKAPIAMEEKLRFAVREGGKTVGSGVVTKILA